MDLLWVPMIKDWHINERHYGALQGLNKAETAAKYGEEQVNVWRRSYDVPPPQLNSMTLAIRKMTPNTSHLTRMICRRANPSRIPSHVSSPIGSGKLNR